MDGVGTMPHGFPKRLGVISAQAFQISVGHNGCRIVAHHATTMARAGPFGQESALLIGIDKAFLHLDIHRRIHHIEQREQAAEGVPEAGIGEHVARQHLSVVRTVVHHAALGVYLVEAAREKHGAVKAGIERTEMIYIAVGHLYAAQYLVPTGTATGRHLVDIVIAEFLQIENGLFRTYERRRHTDVHLLASLCLETDNSTRMVARRAERGRVYRAVGDSGSVSEGFVEDQHEVVFKVIGHTTTIACGIANNHILRRNDLRMRPFIKSVKDYIGLIGLRKSETHGHGTLSGRKLGGHVVVGKIHFIIVRTRHLRLMREPRSALLLVEHGLARDRHHGELAVIVYPRTGLVGLLEAAYLVGPVNIGPSVAHLSRLRHPEIHSPRHGYGRISVSGGKLIFGRRTDKRTHIVDLVCGSDFQHCTYVQRRQ